MDPTIRYVQSPGTVSRTTDGRVYLYRREWDEIVVLEGLGPWIWQCLAEPVSVEELTHDIESVLDLPDAPGQVGPLCAQLIDAEALSRCSS